MFGLAKENVFFLSPIYIYSTVPDNFTLCGSIKIRVGVFLMIVQLSAVSLVNATNIRRRCPSLLECHCCYKIIIPLN